MNDDRDSSTSPVAGVPADLPPEGIAPEQFGLPLLAGLLEHSLEGIVICDAARRYIYLNRAAYEITGRTPEQLIGRDVLTPLAPRAHDALLAGFALSLSGQTGKRGTIVLRPDGSEREIEYSTMRLTVGGQPVVAAILHDVTELHRQTREARALARIAAGLTVDQSMSATLDTLASIVVEETAAEACVFVLIEEDSTRYRLVGGHGFAPGFDAAFNSTGQHAGQTSTVRAFRTRSTQILPNARTWTLANPDFAALHPYLRDAIWEALAAVPLIYRGRALGSLNAYFPAGQPDERELASLEAIAHQAAVAVENANLYFEAQQKAALEERQRLARELHDSVSQALYGIALGARTARTMLERYPDQPERAAEPLDYLLSLSEAGLAEMRALIFELRPESLATEGLASALEKQADAVRTRHKLPVETEICAEPPVELHVKETAYRIAQEALHNAVKHAHATAARLRLTHDASTLTLEISDNGAGFDVSGDFPGHLGLRSMRERTQRLGGTLDVHSAPGEGTTVRLRVPVGT